MERYREILDRKVATVQDVVDLTLMQKGKYKAEANVSERIGDFVRLTGLAIAEEDLSAPAQRGFVSKVLLKTLKLKEGFWYWLTGWERYALRDIQDAGIMKPFYSQWSKLSGSQLIGVFNAALEVEKKRNHIEEEIPEVKEEQKSSQEKSLDESKTGNNDLSNSDESLKSNKKE
ncbi:MAG: hypothetical protein D6767_09735 [Candidatus Hydrogenedentota bacterium]|nr:MAG: hypothetical protein D6767_09735 [Candidatus Hydrogenedentota bacterium]